MQPSSLAIKQWRNGSYSKYISSTCSPTNIKRNPNLTILQHLRACLPDHKSSEQLHSQSKPNNPKTPQRTWNVKQDGGLKRHLLFLFAFFFHLSETIPFFLPLLLTHDKDHVCLYLYGEQEQGVNSECFIKGCQSQWVRSACNISLFHTLKLLKHFSQLSIIM